MAKKYDFPKVELHCHLDGCVRVKTILEQARKRDITLPTNDPHDIKQYVCVRDRASLKEYLEKFKVFLPVFAGDPDGIARLTREAIEDSAKYGIVYTELRYSPHLLANCDVEAAFFQKNKGNLRPKDVVEIVNSAAEQASHDFGIKVRTILCDIAEYPDWGIGTAQLCHEYTNHGVVGFDIANIDGAGHYLKESEAAFEYCRKNGIHRTAHAGEAGDAAQVKQAIEQFGAERIGHGYHAVDDENVLKFCKERNVHFEVCPWSSYLTGSVPEDWKRHPAIRFFYEDVNFSISTDDPGVQLTTINDDYDIARFQWRLTSKDLQKLNLNAANAAFLNDSEKQELVKELESAYGSIKEED